MAVGLPRRVWTAPDVLPGDGLQDFAVYTEEDLLNNTHRILKIKPCKDGEPYPHGCSGLVTAKDELDAWRIAQSIINDSLL